MNIFRLEIEYYTGGINYDNDIYYDYDKAIDIAHKLLDNHELIKSIEIQEMRRGEHGYYVSICGLLIKRKKHVHH